MSAPTPITSLFLALKSVLRDAYEEDRLKCTLSDIDKNVQLVPGQRDLGAVGAWEIVGGIKDFKRRPESARLRRSDGAWVHFSVATCCRAPNQLDVLAYNFELVFARGERAQEHCSRFVRVDLNLEKSDNNRIRELRSHLHPGHDDIQLPWPVAEPANLLRDLLALMPIKER